MHARFSALTALLALAAVHAVSGQTPPCTYSCPEKDTLGVKLGDPSDTNGVLTCDYPPFPEADKEANLGFSCQYSDTDGEGAANNSIFFCPSKAISSCDTVPPPQDPAPATNPPPMKRAPAPRAFYEMKARTMLKKRVPVQVEDRA